jgi:hypothetical protein
MKIEHIAMYVNDLISGLTLDVVCNKSISNDQMKRLIMYGKHIPG